MVIGGGGVGILPPALPDSERPGLFRVKALLYLEYIGIPFKSLLSERISFVY